MFTSCPPLTLQQFRTGSQGYSIQEELQGESREVKFNPANWDSAKYMKHPPHHCFVPYFKRPNGEWQAPICIREAMLYPGRVMGARNGPWYLRHRCHTHSLHLSPIKSRLYVWSPVWSDIFTLFNRLWLYPYCGDDFWSHYMISFKKKNNKELPHWLERFREIWMSWRRRWFRKRKSLLRLLGNWRNKRRNSGRRKRKGWLQLPWHLQKTLVPQRSVRRKVKDRRRRKNRSSRRLLGRMEWKTHLPPSPIQEKEVFFQGGAGL